jgi:hypothetical protein
MQNVPPVCVQAHVADARGRMEQNQQRRSEFVVSALAVVCNKLQPHKESSRG